MTPEQRKLIEEARAEAQGLFDRSAIAAARAIVRKLDEALQPESRTS